MRGNLLYNYLSTLREISVMDDHIIEISEKRAYIVNTGEFKGVKTCNICKAYKRKDDVEWQRGKGIGLQAVDFAKVVAYLCANKVEIIKAIADEATLKLMEAESIKDSYISLEEHVEKDEVPF